MQEGSLWVGVASVMSGNGAALALGFILFVLVGISIPIFIYYWRRNRRD